MTKIWVSLKTSLHRKLMPSDFHDPNLKTHLIPKPRIRTGCSSCTSFKNIKESVINGGVIITSRRFSSDKSPVCSPRSIKSGDFMSELNNACCSPKKASTLVVSDSDYGVSCCGREKVGELEDAEFHHGAKHAVTELVEGDSSRKIVEMIYRTSLMMKTEENYCDSAIMDKVLKVHNTNKTLARFEDYRESV